MTDMQTSLPLLIVWPSILNPVMHFSTQPLTGTLQVIPLPCALHFIFSNVDATQAPTLIKPFDYRHESTLGLIFLERYDPLHIIMWPYWFINLNWVCSSSLPCLSAPSLCSSFPTTCGLLLQSLQLAFHTCNWSIHAKPCLNLLHLATRHYVMSHMPWIPSLHYMSIASTLSYFSSMAHVAHTSVFAWTNHLCIST